MLAVFAVLVVGFAAYTVRHVRHQTTVPTAAGPAKSGPAPATTKQPVSLWIGDSYTAGTGADNPGESEAALAAAGMGWIFNSDAQGGTGFISNGHTNSAAFTPLSGRLSGTVADDLADVVVIDAGRNDPASVRTVDAARRYLARVRAAWPHAKVVLIAPYFLALGTEPNPPVTTFYRTQAKRRDTYLIDPVAEGWVGPQVSSLTISDGVHPNPAGHRYIANHLVRDLKALGVKG